MLAGDFHAQRFGFQPIALAGVARHVGEVARDLLAGPFAVGFLVAALEIGDDAFERPLGLVGARAVVVGEPDLGFAGAVQDRVLGLLRQVLPLGVERELVVLAERGQRLHVIRRRRFRPRRDRALAQRALRVGDDQTGVDVLLNAKAAAFRAGAEWIVEREQPRLDFGNGETGDRAGELFREHQTLGGFVALAVGLGAFDRRGVGHFGDRQTVGELERLLQRVREPRRDVGAHHQAIDHHVDVVGEFLVERRHFADLEKLAVDFDALVALLAELGELLAVLTLAAAHDRREQIKPRAFRQRHDAIDHLRHGLALDRQTGGRRVGHADARPQQPHVVVDLGDGADGGARIARGGFLLDGNGRRQPVDLVDVRLLHHLQELPRVGGQRLHVTALAFSIDGVERERGFSRPGKSGEHHELVARNLDVDVLEIMLARAVDRDDAPVGGAADVVAALFRGRFSLGGLVEQVVHSLLPLIPASRGSRMRNYGRRNHSGFPFLSGNERVGEPGFCPITLYERSENTAALPVWAAE